MEVNKIYQETCLETLSKMNDNSIEIKPHNVLKTCHDWVHSRKNINKQYIKTYGQFKNEK